MTWRFWRAHQAQTTKSSWHHGPANKASRRQNSINISTLTGLGNRPFYIGDNLRDFSEAFAAAKLRSSAAEAHLTEIERRCARVDSAESHWGVDWFILPNPLYGEWEKLLGDQPKLKLRATAMKLSGK